MLRSVDSDPIKVRFINGSGVPADILWVTPDGDYTLYSTLKPRQYIDIDTYSQHYWICKDKGSGRTLLTNNQPHFVGIKSQYRKDIRSSHSRFIVMITKFCIVNSLRSITVDYLCRNLSRCTTVKHLEIPKTLKQEIIRKIHRANPSFHSSDEDKKVCEKNLIIPDNPDVSTEDKCDK